MLHSNSRIRAVAPDASIAVPSGHERTTRRNPRQRADLRPRAAAVVLALLFVLGLSDAGAQPFWDGGRGRMRAPPAPPDRDIFPGPVFTFCTMEYGSVTREMGGFGWSTDYPDAGLNFMNRLAELTTIEIQRKPDGEPRQVTLPLAHPALFDYPYLFSSDVGTLEFTDREVERLRKYLLRGGFLHVDDFWGEAAWARWCAEIGRVLPPREYPIFDLPLNHPIFNIVFKIKEVPQVPSIHAWMRNGGATSERGAETAVPHLRGINDDRGRLMVLMSFNTDIADGWEREGESREYFEEFSVKKSYPLGINIVVYVMTH